jgi:hypothetical protein
MATSIDFIDPNVVHNLETCSRLVKGAWMMDNEFGLASSLTLKGRALFPQCAATRCRSNLRQ